MTETLEAPEQTPEEQARAAIQERRERRIQMYLDAVRRQPDPAHAPGVLSGQDARDRILVEVYVMLEEMHGGFATMFETFRSNGGGLGAILKMLK